MINLLEGEVVTADLRLGAIQRISEDLFRLKTIVLTNKRLILVNKKLGTFTKQYIFLKDVQGLVSHRQRNLGNLIVGVIFCLLAIVLIVNGSIFGLLAALASVPAFLNVNNNSIRVSTMTEDLYFQLEKSFSTDDADSFVDRVQVQMELHKR